MIYFYEGISSWELYDLMKDPHEVHNIYGKKENGKTIVDLKSELKKLIIQYKDDEALKMLENNWALIASY